MKIEYKGKTMIVQEKGKRGRYHLMIPIKKALANDLIARPRPLKISVNKIVDATKAKGIGKC